MAKQINYDKVLADAMKTTVRNLNRYVPNCQIVTRNEAIEAMKMVAERAINDTFKHLKEIAEAPCKEFPNIPDDFIDIHELKRENEILIKNLKK